MNTADHLETVKAHGFLDIANVDIMDSEGEVELPVNYEGHFKPENLAYINVLNNLSIDCDCDSNPKDPEMADIGILASLDPVALDKCSYDFIINSSDPKKESLIQRMEEKHAIHTVYSLEELGCGSTNYELIKID